MVVQYHRLFMVLGCCLPVSSQSENINLVIVGNHPVLDDVLKDLELRWNLLETQNQALQLAQDEQEDNTVHFSRIFFGRVTVESLKQKSIVFASREERNKGPPHKINALFRPISPHLYFREIVKLVGFFYLKLFKKYKSIH